MTVAPHSRTSYGFRKLKSLLATHMDGVDRYRKTTCQICHRLSNLGTFYSFLKDAVCTARSSEAGQMGNEKQMSSGSEGKPRAEKPSSWEKEQISSL